MDSSDRQSAAELRSGTIKKSHWKFHCSTDALKYLCALTSVPSIAFTSIFSSNRRRPLQFSCTCKIYTYWRKEFVLLVNFREREFDNDVKPSQLPWLTVSRISASAAGVRGLMEHLKGTGYLFKTNFFFFFAFVFLWKNLRQEFTSKFGFKFDDIALVVNWWFDVIDSEKTGHDWV